MNDILWGCHLPRQYGIERPTMDELRDKLTAAADKPGVYLMKDAEGAVIYVGKARSLKKRLATYFNPRPGRLDPKTEVLVRQVADVETILTGSENEALILESTLIKRHRPRYNVVLKDDKRYPSLRIDPKAPYPFLSIVRQVKPDGALYFGPFTSAGAVRDTYRLINKTFKLRKCRTKAPRERARPCLNHQIGTCLAPCCLPVSEEAYGQAVNEVILFLRGRTPELLRDLRREMAEAAAVQAYETAAAVRDRIFAIEKVLEKQVVVTADGMDRDVFAVARAAHRSMVVILFVRGGCLQGSRSFSFGATLAGDGEMISTFIRQYYERVRMLPREVLVPLPLPDEELLTHWLSERAERRVRLHFPRRGEKVRLLKAAEANAENALKALLDSSAESMDLLRRLGDRLKLPAPPLRIECFDNANLAGTEAVSGMVVFQDGRPAPDGYRRYRIKTAPADDDYAAMTEVLSRRYRRGESVGPFPDLLMVDGGRGQLGMAVAVLDELGLRGEIPVIGIAKRDEKRGETEDKIFQPGRANPVAFGRDRDILLFLERIRDEAHRFANTYHRRRRSKAALTSALDEVPGIGPRRKRTLLRHFGSVDRIRRASEAELAALPGLNQSVARALKAGLSDSGDGRPA